MSANQQPQTSTPEEVKQVIAEFDRQYWQPLIDDTLERNQNVKMPQQEVMKQLKK
ncbi:hypothetical protein [Microcoleus sp. Pol12B4]|uniref:hypothetical protein n=1 Tax=Microcoleus sp. Pol12B4 TaxID=3055395 RepID=UPI002FD126E8